MSSHFLRTSRPPLPVVSAVSFRLVAPALARAAFACLVALSGLAHAQSTDTPLPSLWPSKEAWDAPEPWRTDRFYVQAGVGTIHFHYDSAHQQAVLLDMEYRFKERWLEGQWIAGLTLFTTSFGQFSQYAYGALQWRPSVEHQPFYLKVSAGIVHGYSGEYQDKIPFNSTGFAPVIIPSAGYCWGRYCGEVILLGANALQFAVGATLP